MSKNQNSVVAIDKSNTMLVVRNKDNKLSSRDIKLLNEFGGDCLLSSSLVSDFSIAFNKESYEAVVGVSVFETAEELYEALTSIQELARYFDDEVLFQKRRFICQGFDKSSFQEEHILKAIELIENESNTKFVYINNDDSLIDVIVNELLTMVKEFDEDTLYQNEYQENQEEFTYGT